MGGATKYARKGNSGTIISIHAPRGGSDGIIRPVFFGPFPFQSTLPVGERLRLADAVREAADFNPRSPCGERPTLCTWTSWSCTNFNPRSPCGERPNLLLMLRREHGISIHAPRVGSDCWRRIYPPAAGHFNPRSPCGERRQMSREQFQELKISIHAPRVGSDGR